MKRPSITVKLFLGFLGLLVLALGTLGGISTVWFIQQESQNLNSFLESEAKGIANRLAGMIEGLTLEKPMRRSDVSLAMRLDVKNYLETRVNRPIPYKTTLLILDDQNHVLGQSNRALDLTGPVTNLGAGELRIEDITGHGPAYRVLSSRFKLVTGTQGTFRIASLLSSLNAPLLSFLTSLSLILGGSMLILSGLGYWLIVSALRPVRTMADAATKISDQNLATRIPLPPGNDNLTRLAHTFNNMLERLETDFAFQDRLVGDLTHQLKTPLTILRGRNELGLTVRRSAAEFKELVEDNIADLDAVGTLLDSILELARYDSHLDKLVTQEVDLAGMVRDLGEELQPFWVSKSLKFRTSGPEVSLQADPVALRQILMNLYDNAWKHAPTGTEIYTEWSSLPAQLILRVFNQGLPIPDGEAELIFKRFFRSAQSEQAVTGSGLGLSIVRSLMTLHGGTIRALNPPKGGVCFEMRWPRT